MNTHHRFGRGRYRRARTPLAVILIAGMLFMAVPTLGSTRETPQQAFERGNLLLRQGDFDGALGALRAAARGAKSNETYAQAYALLRRIVKLRTSLQRETNRAKWMQGAAALRAYYFEHGLFAEALAIDTKRFQHDPSSESATDLAATHLALNQNAKAESVLAQLPGERRTLHTSILRGLAIARLGRVEQARSLARVLAEHMTGTDPAVHYDLARLHALAGERETAAAALVRTFEQTPPSRAAALKEHIAQCTDFNAIRGDAAFRTALTTASKVKESGCSSGTDCGKCPSRSKCKKTKS